MGEGGWEKKNLCVGWYIEDTVYGVTVYGRLCPGDIYAARGLQHLCGRVSAQSFQHLDNEAGWKRYVGGRDFPALKATTMHFPS